MAGSDYMEFGIGDGDDKITSGKFERFKGKEGESYRVSFVWWDLLAGKPDFTKPSPKFIGAKRHFIQGVGYVLDKPEIAKLAGGPAKQAVATILAKWPVDRKGQLDKTAFANGTVEVVPWIFSKTTYDQLVRRHSEFSFAQYDLAIACTDTQFQKMDLSPCKENLFAKVLASDRMKETAALVLGRTQEIADNLRNMLAQDLTPDKVREKMGQAPAGPVVTPGTTEKVDEILDDILE